MGWTSNDLRIEMMNDEAAKSAAEAIKNYVNDNASHYETLNLNNLMTDLLINGSTVVLEDSYSMHGCDYMIFVTEICKVVATVGSFKGEAFYCSGYGDEGSVNFTCDDGMLNLKTICYPNGHCEYLPCEECGEDVIRFDEYKEGKLYICPECGEELDLADVYEEYKPEFNEIVIKIK